MNVPQFNYSKVIDDNGMYTPQWQTLLTQLITELTKNFGTEGIITPGLPSSEILLLNNMVNGTMIYDQTNNLQKILINGVLKTIQTS